MGMYRVVFASFFHRFDTLLPRLLIMVSNSIRGSNCCVWSNDQHIRYWLDTYTRQA